ncbi:MAG: hypothetical protein GQ534_03305, partial [Candidatus Delongbacteria bacterium]|nr:hypothetical protein [Candidatus Delongbacteria bacterium]
MDKISVLSKIIHVDELSILIENILKKMDLKEIKRLSEDIIVATQRTPLEARKLCFVNTLTELDGKVKEIKAVINKLDIKYDTIYIVTSNRKLTDYFKRWIKSKFTENQFEFWSSKEVIDKIDSHYSDFWGHNDAFIKSYEEYYTKNIKKESDLRKILKLDKNIDKQLDMFIEPNIYTFEEDREAERLVRVKIKRENITNGGSYVISGEAGTGKTTLLKEIGSAIINLNHNSNNKSIPILIKANDIHNANCSLKNAFEEILLKTFKSFDLDNIYK